MTELVYSDRQTGMSSSFVGTVICWISGVLTCTAAVAYSVSGSFQNYLIGLTVLFLGACVCGWAHSASSKTKLRLSAAFLAILLVAGIAECALRMMTEYPIIGAARYVPDVNLGYVMDPQLSDVDSGGFRNSAIPKQFDVIAIGDSQTQGVGVATQKSWPAVLSHVSQRHVYSMAVAGYGPQHYQQLVANAIAHKPKQIIVGLSTGTDINDVSRRIAGRPLVSNVRNSFRHAVQHKMALGSFLHQWITRKTRSQSQGIEIVHATNPTYFSHTQLTFLQNSLDTTQQPVAASLQQSISMISQMQQACSAANVRFSILLIPSRELVYRDFLRDELAQQYPALIEASNQERQVRQQLASAFNQYGIPFADAAPALVAALDQAKNVYANDDDEHPRQAGYAAYAETAATLLQ